MEGRFNAISWAVIAAYMIFTTVLGAWLSGKQATIKEFFLGGRKLPWYAVSGSIIATELSAMTLVGVPAFLWADTGDMKYAVLAIGGLVARLIVGFIFVPKFYEREIYSPYEYIGNKLGERANHVTSAMFMIGGILGQGTRVLLTAIVLQVVTGLNIYASIWIVGFVAVVWTFLGGITTVIWTDVIQFVIFTFTAIFMLWLVSANYVGPGGETGLGAIWDFASDYDKFRWLDWSPDIRKDYTFWSALIASGIGGLAAYGTDQMMAQRMFCCKGPAEARKAIIASWLSQALMVACLFTGVALWAYYKKNGMPDVPNAEEARQIGENANRLVPVFVKFRVPAAVGGLIVAGIFAAAVSSLDSILAALSQQTLAFARRHRRKPSDDRQDISLSRVFIVFWGVALCTMATVFQLVWSGKGLIIELALSVVGLTHGAVLGAFLIAFVPAWRRRARGMEWAAAISVMAVFAFMQHGGIALRTFDGLAFLPDAASFKFIFAWPPVALLVASVVLVLTAMAFRMKEDRAVLVKLLPFLLVILFLNVFQYRNAEGEWSFLRVGWPWYTPIGTLVMILASFAICRALPAGEEADVSTERVDGAAAT